MNSTGSFTLSGGKTITAFTETIGNGGTGSLLQTGGTHTVNHGLTLGEVLGGAGTYTLNGGELKVASIVNGAGTGTFNLNGGTLNLTGASIDVDNFNIGGDGAGSTGSGAISE